MHVLHNEVCGAEVDESLHLFPIRKVESLEHIAELLLPIVLVEHISILLDDLVPLLELILAILTYHVLLELPELTRRDIDKLVIARGGRPCGSGGCVGRLRIFVLLASILVCYLGALLGIRSFGNC